MTVISFVGRTALRAAGAWGASAALLLAGCYGYVPAATTAPEPGREVRVSLTDGGTAGLAAVVGPGVVALDGRVVASADSALTLALTGTTRRNGVEDPWRGERVVVRRDHVASLAERTFSRGRTAAAGAGFLALGTFLYKVLGDAIGGSGGRRGGGPVER